LPPSLSSILENVFQGRNSLLIIFLDAVVIARVPSALSVHTHIKGQCSPVSQGCVRKRWCDLRRMHHFSKNCVMRNTMCLGDIRIAATKRKKEMNELYGRGGKIKGYVRRAFQISFKR